MEKQVINFKYFVGIDVSKNYFDVTILNELEKKIAHKKFDNNHLGYFELLEFLKAIDINSLTNSLFCMEHTGIYVRALMHYLQDSQCYICLEPALEIKLSLGILRGKNDKIDSKRIAEYAHTKRHKIKITPQYDADIEKLHDMMSTRERITTSLAALSTAQEEYKNFDFESYQQIKDAQNQAISGLKESLKRVDFLINQQIEKQEAWKRNLKLGKSITGLGKITILWFMVYTRNFQDEYTARKIAAYCGIAPYENSSGTTIRNGTHISHLAQKKLKVLLHTAVMSAIRCDPKAKEYFHKKKKEGKHGYLVMNNLKNKLVHILIGVVRSGKIFDPNYEANRLVA